jgi:hypothetical protein
MPDLAGRTSGFKVFGFGHDRGPTRGFPEEWRTRSHCPQVSILFDYFLNELIKLLIGQVESCRIVKIHQMCLTVS